MNRRRTSFLKPMEQTETTLPLTPMADVLVVILIFLLKGVSMNLDLFGMRSDIRLPEGHGNDRTVKALRISIGQREISLGDKVFASWPEYQHPSPQGDGGLDVDALSKALIRSGFLDEAKKAGTHFEIHADREAPYAVVRSVLSLATTVGASEIQLGVLGK